jgi:uncharacterized repeat protein (TIGR01451 family)
LIVALIIGTVAIIGNEPVNAATINVNSSMNLSEIQGAIDGANINDTIKFESGVYENQSIIINKTLNIVGENGVIIKAVQNISSNPITAEILRTQYAITRTSAFYFVTGASGSSISGLTITTMGINDNEIGYSDALIYSNNASNLEIFNNTLNYSSWGIYIDVSPDPIIRNNTISNSIVTGVISFGSPRAIIRDNNIYNVGNHGIDVRHGSGPNATIYNNLVSGASEGIYLMHSQGHKVYNNTVDKTYLSSITAYGAGNLAIYNNTLKGGYVGIFLASGFYNVTLKDNDFSGLKRLPYPPTFSSPLVIGDSSYNSVDNANGVFTDSAEKQAKLTITAKYSKTTITNGETTTYTIKITNIGDFIAKNITLKGIVPKGLSVVSSSASRGTYTNGVWNIESIVADSDVFLTLTVKPSSAGTFTNSITGEFNDNIENVDIIPITSTLKTNKNIKLSYSYYISKKTIKVGQKLVISIKASNTGLDKSDKITIKNTLPKTLKLQSYNQKALYKSGKWTANVNGKKSITFNISVKALKKGTIKVPVYINNKKVKTFVIKVI